MSNHRFMMWWPPDWLKDIPLRKASPPARALWIDMICMAHDGEPYGHVTVGGLPASIEDLSVISRIPPSRVRRYVDELLMLGVCSIDENQRIYCRRMIRDHAKFLSDKANGKTGGNPNLKKGVNPPVNHNSEAYTKSESTSTRGAARPLDGPAPRSRGENVVELVAKGVAESLASTVQAPVGVYQAPDARQTQLKVLDAMMKAEKRPKSYPLKGEHLLAARKAAGMVK